MKQKLLLLCLVIATILSLSTIAAAAEHGMENFTKLHTYKDGQFQDVPQGSWYTDNVITAYEIGLVYGTSDTTFSPSGNIDIASTITLACRLHKIYRGDTSGFQASTPWYQAYVDYATQNHIIASGTFENYSAKATRAEFASIMAGALPTEALPTINNIEENSLPDVPVTADYADDVYLLYRSGILKGSDTYGTFRPTSMISRSEVAAIVTRMADKSLRLTFTLEVDTPDYEELFGDHLLLDGKGFGGCTEFVGDIVLTVVLVNDDASTWGDEDTDLLENTISATLGRFSDWAEDYGQAPTLSVVYEEITISGDSRIEHITSINDTANAIFRAAELPSLETLNDALEERYNADEAPVIIMLNNSGRSGTYTYPTVPCEFSIICFGNPRAGYLTIEHELLHQFGAGDYYYPPVVEDLATDYFPNSVMYTIGQQAFVDDLTAYLIGWTDTLPEECIQFLLQSANMAAGDELTVRFSDGSTGHVTEKTVTVGTYTGYVENGFAQGEGVFARFGGATYTGNFKDGKRSGYGVEEERDGTKYVGQWENNLRHGEGTVYDANGNVLYSGRFENGSFVG